MQTYTITSYDPATGNHTLESERGVTQYCDLFVSDELGDFESKDEMDAFAQSLVSKKVSIERETAYISIATGITIHQNEEVLS